MSIYVVLFGLAFIANLLSATFAINLFLRSKTDRLAAGFFASALILMLSRLIFSISEMLDGKPIGEYDPALSFAISILMLISITHFKKLVIELELKNNSLKKLSKLDPLTGALSRVETFERSELEIDRSIRNGHELSFLMLDIDHFKNVNDQYGHATGDLVLVNLVKHCQSQLRKIDIFGRVGGEEFFITLPESSESNAYETAERLRLYIEKMSTSSTCGKQIAITISIGIATFNPKSNSDISPAAILKNFYEMSDAAMYSAKQSGRNQVVVWNASCVK
jgi:diguanylate cyclase (GGDEF)-like protein